MLFVLCAIASVVKFAFCGDTSYLIVAAILCVAFSIQFVFEQFKNMLKNMLETAAKTLADFEKKKQEAKMECAVKSFTEFAQIISKFGENKK